MDRVDALALTIDHFLTRWAASYASVVLPVHVVPTEAYAFAQEFVILTVGRAGNGAGFAVRVVHRSYGASSTDSINEIVGRGTFAFIVEGINLRAGAAINTPAIFKSISIDADTLPSQHVVDHIS